MAVITDNTNSGIEVDLPDTFNGNNDNGGNDRDAEAASTSYEEEDTFSISSAAADGGKSWMWNSINPMNIFIMLFVVILLVLTGGLSATAAKSNVVDNMSSNIKAPKASKGPTAKSTKGPTCKADGQGPCETSADCCSLVCDNLSNPNKCVGFSDRRLKHKITLIDKSPSNIPIYTFKYRSGMQLANKEVLDNKSTFVGAMAQDLLEIAPHAVIMNDEDGYYRVDYSKIDVDFYKL